MGGSAHVLHVVSSMTLTELRDADVLSGFIHLWTETEMSLKLHLELQVKLEGRGLTLSLWSGPSMETSSISSPMLSSLLERSER